MAQAALAKTKEASNSADRQDWSAHDNCDHIPNAETIAAFEETEDILRKIKEGKLKPLSWEEYLNEKQKWLDEADDEV